MLNEQEQTVVLEAREILGRYLSRNPVIGSWQAVCGIHADEPYSQGRTGFAGFLDCAGPDFVSIAAHKRRPCASELPGEEG